MGSIHFPSNPRANNVYTLNGQVWWYDGMSWNAIDRGLANPCPLDSLTAKANVAYGCRQLYKSYTGPIVQLRRASDGVTTIFNVQNNLHANIASFLTGTTGWVVVWYDQSGAGLNAIQSVPGQQPGWNISCQNGQSALDFPYANSPGLIANTSSSLYSANSNFTMYVSTSSWANQASYPTLLGMGGSSQGWVLQDTTSGSNTFTFYSSTYGGTLSGVTTLNDNKWRTFLVTSNVITAAVNIYAENALSGSSFNGGGLVIPNTGLYIGPYNYGDPWGGSIGEFAYFIGNTANPLSSTDLSTIYSSSLFYWGAN